MTLLRWLGGLFVRFWNWDGGDTEQDLVASVEMTERSYKRELARYELAVAELREYREGRKHGR